MNTDIFEKSWNEKYNEQFRKSYGIKQTLKQEIEECKFFIKCIEQELQILQNNEVNNVSKT